jgi:preprotein translocase subunit SecA
MDRRGGTLAFMKHRPADTRAYEELVRRVCQFGTRLSQHTDGELGELTNAFRVRLADGESPEDLLPEAFAAVRDAARRVTGLCQSEAQLVAGAAVYAGNVAELADGEGKSMAALLAAYVHALADQGVHVVTRDDHLAQRDANRAAAILGTLGMTVGVVIGGSTALERKRAYAAGVTYSSYHQLGYDYLRDNLA